MINNVKRNKDVVSGRSDLEFLAKIPNLSARMGVSDDNYTEDHRLDMDCYISKSSGMLQINPLLDLNFLYGRGHGAGTIGGTWSNHHKDLSDFISKFRPSSILEPGGGHGLLAQAYADKNDQLDSWNILEPSEECLPPKFNSSKIISEIGFFNKKFVDSSKKYNAVVHSHVLEHIYEPMDFLRDCNDILQDNGYLIFSIPNVDYGLKEMHANCLMFEHTYLASEAHVDYMCQKNGFRLIDKKYFGTHSKFFCYQKDIRTSNANISMPKLYNRNKEQYLKFISFIKDRVSIANSHLLEEGNKNNCFVFGAHIFSQILFSFGLKEDSISAVLDNDKSKIGKRLYGWNSMVLSPEVLKGLDSPLIILNAGAYNEELKKQILSSINSKARFI